MEGWQGRKAGICAYNMIATLFLTYVKKKIADTAMPMVNFIESY